MNKARRAALNAVLNNLHEQKDYLENICEDEENAKDNMPESLQGTDRYEMMEEAVDAMSDAIGALEDAIDSLEGVF